MHNFYGRGFISSVVLLSLLQSTDSERCGVVFFVIPYTSSGSVAIDQCAASDVCGIVYLLNISLIEDSISIRLATVIAVKHTDVDLK